MSQAPDRKVGFQVVRGQLRPKYCAETPVGAQDCRQTRPGLADAGPGESHRHPELVPKITTFSDCLQCGVACSLQAPRFGTRVPGVEEPPPLAVSVVISVSMGLGLAWT